MERERRSFYSELYSRHNMFSRMQHLPLEENSATEKSYYHIAVLGDGKVGKSCIIDRLMNKSFQLEHTPTVSELYEVELQRKEKPFATLCIYDTAGSIAFPVMNKLTISKCDACVIVYAVDNLKSLKEAERQFHEIREIKEDSFPCVLVGNKRDTLCREVTFDRGLRCAIKFGASYIEMSAKEDENVKDAFETVVKKIGHIELFKKKILNGKKKLVKGFSARRNLSVNKYFV